MIQLNNIHISFDKTIIENGSLTIPEHQITAIIGDSGSGKTSLLYLIGLIRIDNSIKYDFNGIPISYSQQQMENIKKYKIGYVLQSNQLLDYLTVYENMKFFANLTDKHIDEKEALHYLKEMNLEIELDQPVTQLSGGELQRLAISCSLTKEPELLIIDEPTSALDSQNRDLLIALLKKLCNRGLTILITSHDRDVISHCDVLYEIQDKKISLIKTTKKTKEEKISLLQKKSLSVQFYFNYYWHYITSHKALITSIFAITAFTISSLLCLLLLGPSYNKQQESNIESISHKEIFVSYNSINNGQIGYSENLPPLDENIISNVKQDNRLEGYQTFNIGYGIELSSSNNNISTSFIVVGYHPLKEIDSHLLYGTQKENGIYFSYDLKDDYIEGDLINLCFESEDGNIITLENQILAGIFKGNMKQWVDISCPIVYIPYDMMPYTSTTRAMLLYARHYADMNDIKEDLLEINSDLDIYWLHNDITNLDNSKKVITIFTSFVTVSICVLSTCLLCLIYSRYFGQREGELSILRLNGFSNKEINLLVLIELLINTFIITLLSLPYIYLIKGFIQLFLSIDIQTHIFMLLISSFVFGLLLTLIPTLLTLSLLSKKDAVYILR